MAFRYLLPRAIALELSWPRSPERHLQSTLSSSRFSPFSQSTIAKSCSLQALRLSPSFPFRSASLASAFCPLPHCRPVYRRLPVLRSVGPIRSFSFSLGRELDGKEQPQSQPQQSAASCSKDEGYHDHLHDVQQAKQGRFIPVKAYFLSTSIDLRSLQAQNASNVVPPNSRSTNYVVFRYHDLKSDPQALERGFLNESKCHYMVVFQYGSVVLFNVSDHDAEGYLKIVEKHSSGLLTEMRKDGVDVELEPFRQFVVSIPFPL